MRKPLSRAAAWKAAAIALYAAVVLPLLHPHARGYLVARLQSGEHLHSGFNLGYFYFDRFFQQDRYLITNYVLLFFLPALMILLLFRDAVKQYGLDRGDARAGLRLYLVFFIPSLIVMSIAARRPEFQLYYPMYAQARAHWTELLFWEVAYNGCYMFCWEFFFRGFMLFGLRRGIGNWAILLQAVAFGLMHYGKPMPEFLVSFATGIALGLVALRARSFLPTFGLHSTLAISFDLAVLAWGGHWFR